MFTGMPVGEGLGDAVGVGVAVIGFVFELNAAPATAAAAAPAASAPEDAPAAVPVVPDVVAPSADVADVAPGTVANAVPLNTELSATLAAATAAPVIVTVNAWPVRSVKCCPVLMMVTSTSPGSHCRQPIVSPLGPLAISPTVPRTETCDVAVANL